MTEAAELIARLRAVLMDNEPQLFASEQETIREAADRLETLEAEHSAARQNFHTMQHAANALRQRAEAAEARVAELVKAGYGKPVIRKVDRPPLVIEPSEPGEAWNSAYAVDPGTIRICPMRDGPCHHGLNCQFVGDGYSGYPCKPGWNAAREASQ